jgi:hypothetical protein
MYTTKVDGVLFNDWLTQLLDGESVEDVGESLVKVRKSATAAKTPAAIKTAPASKSPKKPKS